MRHENDGWRRRGPACGFDPNWKRFMRPDAYRYIRPDISRFMPAGAPVYTGRDVVKYFWLVKRDDDAQSYARKFSPDQPRVPAGNPDGGQWTGGAVQSRIRLAQLAEDGSNDGGLIDVLPSSTDLRPMYGLSDAALLAPKGVKPEASTQRLEYVFSDSNRYLGGVTVVNEDRTLVGRMIQTVNSSPLRVAFEAEVETTDGTFKRSFEITKALPPGGTVTIPWKEFGLMQGPGSVRIRATNLGSLFTGVIIGAMRADSHIKAGTVGSRSHY